MSPNDNELVEVTTILRVPAKYADVANASVALLAALNRIPDSEDRGRITDVLIESV